MNFQELQLVPLPAPTASSSQKIARLDRTPAFLRDLLAATQGIEDAFEDRCPACASYVVSRRQALTPGAACRTCEDLENQRAAARWYLERASVSGLHIHPAVDF